MVVVLVNIESIEVLEETEVVEGSRGFTWKLDVFSNQVIVLLGNGFGWTGQGKVINLTKEKDLVTLESGRVDGLVMGSGLEVQVGRSKDASNVFFPETAGFRMALKSMKNRENKGAIQSFLEVSFVPISILIVDGDKGQGFRRRGVSESILCIASINAVSELCRESKEETLNGLFDTRRVSRSDHM